MTMNRYNLHVDDMTNGLDYPTARQRRGCSSGFSCSNYKHI